MPATVVDGYLADFWKQVFTDITVHTGLTLRTGGTLAVAFRKNSPMLAKEIDGFIAKYSHRYRGQPDPRTSVICESTKYVKNATSEAERKKFTAMRDLFLKYGDRYKFDYLMMGAQVYQESRLDQNARSPVGAIGVMQVMPETGKEQKVGDITQLEPNIHAGVKYMRFVRDQYFGSGADGRPQQGVVHVRGLQCRAGSNPAAAAEAEKRGLDPNVWFGNVERIASERIGRETVTYVSNIYKYYVAYRLITEETERRQDARELVATDAPPADTKAATGAKPTTSGTPTGAKPANSK